MKTARPYRQRARAEGREKTRVAILDAAVRLFRDEGNLEASLSLVADRAHTTTRTLLRHFKSKAGLMDAAIAHEEAKVATSREAPPGDVATAMDRLIAHYEQMGDAVLRMLAAEDRFPAVKRVTDGGKALHRGWVETIFESDLQRVGAKERRRLIATLATVTDVHVWGLLRRRYGLSVSETTQSMTHLVHAVQEENS